MIYKKIATVFFTLVLLGSCSRDSSKTVTITWDDFPVTHTLKGQKVDLSKLETPPFVLSVLRDSIGLVWAGTNKHYAVLANLNTGRALQNICPIGRGPGEFTYPDFSFNNYNYSRGDLLSIADRVQNKLVTYHLDSLLKHGEAASPVAEFTCRLRIDEVVGLSRIKKDDYLAFNRYFMSYGNYINKDIPALFRTHQALEDEVPFEERLGREIKYNTFGVSRRMVYANAQHQNVVLVDSYSDNIRIYDKKTLSLKKEIRGPDLKLTSLVLNGVRVEPKHGLKISYAEGCYNDDFIFLAYVNQLDTESKSNENRPPAAIFKIDWEGNLVACYYLDTSFLRGMSISKDGKTLYASTPSKDYKEFTFVKYELP